MSGKNSVFISSDGCFNFNDEWKQEDLYVKQSLNNTHEKKTYLHN